MKDNIINFNEAKNKTENSVTHILNEALKDTEELNIVNCMIVMVDEHDTITYSYANFYRKITMVGALETLKKVYQEDDDF